MATKEKGFVSKRILKLFNAQGVSERTDLGARGLHQKGLRGKGKKELSEMRMPSIQTNRKGEIKRRNKEINREERTVVQYLSTSFGS